MATGRRERACGGNITHMFLPSMRRLLLLACVFLSCSALTLAQPATTAADQQPVRVAIIGLEHGHVVGFLQQFPKQTDTQLIGIVDPDPGLRAKYQQQFHLDASLFYPTLDDLFAHQQPQALLVYTSIAQHRRVIEAAAVHNVAVMVEKPLTLSLDDALAIRRIAREHHIQVLVNYETTWYPSNRALYDLLRHDSLGELRKAVIHDGHQGPKEIGVQPEFLNWLTDPAQNGAGALYDFGCYGADLMTWFMHGESPVSVTAVAQTDKPDTYPHVDDDATIILRYPHARRPCSCLPGTGPFGRKDTEVYGTTGYAIAVNPSQLRERVSEASPEVSPSASPPLAVAQRHVPALPRRRRPRPACSRDHDLTALDTNVVSHADSRRRPAIRPHRPHRDPPSAAVMQRAAAYSGM
jgi:glucose-fructose oxidoreductase